MKESNSKNIIKNTIIMIFIIIAVIAIIIGINIIVITKMPESNYAKKINNTVFDITGIEIIERPIDPNTYKSNYSLDKELKDIKESKKVVKD